MYGKWHLGRTPGRFPTDQGFDEWYGILNSTDESVYSALPGFAESGVAETFVMESRKGEVPKKVRPYRLERVGVKTLFIEPGSPWVYVGKTFRTSRALC